MTIKVFDFRTTGKLSVNASCDALMQGATFIMLVDKDRQFKEFMVTIPKRYHFITLTSPANFLTGKTKEYDVLKDFILDNKSMLCDKWKLSKSEYEELLEGLWICLIEEYSKYSSFVKWLMLFPISFKKFVRRTFGGVGV